MSTQFDAIGQAGATAALAVAQAIGIQFDFRNRGGSWVTLNGYLVAQKQGYGEPQRGRQQQVLWIQLRIPTGQTGFSYPSDDTQPATFGDEIRYPSGGTVVFNIEADGIEYENNRHTYLVSANQNKTLTLGNRA